MKTRGFLSLGFCGLLLAGIACTGLAPALGDTETAGAAPTRDVGTAAGAEAYPAPPAPSDCIGAACAADETDCDEASIRRAPSGEVCATCDGASGVTEICGVPTRAACFEVESGSGEPCERCVSETGEILFDNCGDLAFDVAGIVCETVRRGTEAPRASPSEDARPACSQDADCGEGFICQRSAGSSEGVCLALTEGVDCEICTDPSGQVVREQCRPTAEYCEERVDDAGRTCSECFLQGELVWRECGPLPISPTMCERYAGPEGQCLDCYDEGGVLLLHDCQLTAPVGADLGSAVVGAGFCDEVVVAGGAVCQTCYDGNGNMTSVVCEDTSAPSYCEEWVYSEQTCVVCVDAMLDVTFTECRANTCASEETCAAPACEMRYGVDGTLCRVCPVGLQGETEQRCVNAPPLFCFWEEVYAEAPTTDGQASAPPSLDVCAVCLDSTGTQEVYRSCGVAENTVGGPVPVLCRTEMGSNGEECVKCEDAIDGAAVLDGCESPG